jgi:hypothetical protein
MGTPSKLHSDFYRLLTGKEPDTELGIPPRIARVIEILGDVQVRRTLVKANLLERRTAPAQLAERYGVSVQSIYFHKHVLSRGSQKPPDEG